MPKVKSAGTKKTKAKKDPNAPKRPLSAYFIWLQDFRAQMRIERPDLVKSVRDFGKAAGEAWKDVTLEEREPYQEKHLVLKANYQTAMESYTPPNGYSKAGSMSTKKLKDPNAPKKPSTAFFLFMGDGNRTRLKQENPEITPSEVGKVLGAEWRELDQKIKSGYEKTYEMNLIQWRKDKAAYENTSLKKKEESEDEESDSE